MGGRECTISNNTLWHGPYEVMELIGSVDISLTATLLITSLHTTGINQLAGGRPPSAVYVIFVYTTSVYTICVHTCMYTHLCTCNLYVYAFFLYTLSICIHHPSVHPISCTHNINVHTISLYTHLRLHTVCVHTIYLYTSSLCTYHLCTHHLPVHNISMYMLSMYIPSPCTLQKQLHLFVM